MITRVTIIVCLVMACNPAVWGEEPMPILPETWHEWKANEPADHYDRSSLYKFINGGAELYLAFGFENLVVQRYQRHDGVDLELEIDLFDMGAVDNAYGMFRHDLEDDEAGVGSASEYGAGWLRFYQGRYFVYLTANAQGLQPETKKIIVALGKDIAALLPPGSETPPLIKLLPQQGLVPKSIRYFKNHTVLNHYFYISNRDLFDLADKTPAVFATYKEAGQQGHLLLISYRDQAAAQRVSALFIATYLPEAGANMIAKTENGRWCSIKPLNATLIVILDATSSEYAAQLQARVASALKGEAHGPK